MTAKELHEQKIIPLRLQLQDLEIEYRELYRKECGEKIGENASCNNCAMSCVLSIDSHNRCMGGKCTCCHSWCFSWTPENEVSKFLREKHHYDDYLCGRLEDIFGDCFLRKCDNPEKAQVVMEMLGMIAKFNGKGGDKQ